MFFGGLVPVIGTPKGTCGVFPAHLMCLNLLAYSFYGLWLRYPVQGLLLDQCKGQTQ